MTTFSAVILAGGRSSRMGMPKAALPFGDSTILERLIDTLTPGFAEIVVVAAPLSDEPFSLDRILQHRAGLKAASAAIASDPADAASDPADAVSPDSDDIARLGALENLKHRTNLIVERDDAAFEGPVGALRRGIARANNDIVFACSCDLPLLRFDLAIAICEILEGRRPATLPAAKIPVTLATQTDESASCVKVSEVALPANRFDAAIPSIESFPQPLCAAYRREPAIAALLAMETAEERRLTAIADQLKANVIDEVVLREIDPDLRSFLNVNTAEDYARALRLVRPA
jgi:molybdopterin-guanine dinucleotide biosynthesis protein A